MAEGGFTPEMAVQPRPEMGKVRPLEKHSEAAPKKEILGKQKVKVFFTDHSADRPDTGSPEIYSKTCETAIQMGADFMRSDVRMNILYPQPGIPDQQAMDRYASSFASMKEHGLESGLPVMGSTLPKWMMERYDKGDKEGFQQGWKNYNQFVVDNLAKKGVTVDKVQVFNELNHFIAPKIAPEDLAQMFKATREAFSQLNPNVEIWTSLAVSSVLEKVAKTGMASEAVDFLEKLEPAKDSLDGVMFDQYAGTWDARPIEANKGKLSIKEMVKSPRAVIETFKNRKQITADFWRNMFRYTDPLEAAIKKANSMGLKPGIGEMGFPAKGEGQKQLEFFRNYPFALNRTLNKLAMEGEKLPEELIMGLYEVNDERYAGVPWEKYWGVINEGAPKPIAQEGFVFEDKVKQAGREVPEIDQPVRLRKMVDYLKRGTVSAISSGKEQFELKQVR